MNSRERVMAALSHQEPDRVPIDIWGSASRVCDKLYFEICKDQGWNDFGPRVCASRSGNYVDYRLEELVGSDFRHTHVGKAKYYAPYLDADGNEINEWGIGIKKNDGEPYISMHPLQHTDDESAIDNHAWPNPSDSGRLAGALQQVKYWKENTDFCVATTSVQSGLMLDIGPYLRGFEEFFMDLYINESFAHKLIGKMTDLLIEFYCSYLKPIGEYVDIVEFSSDHGMQDRTFMDQELYRKFFKGPYTRLFSEVKKVAPKAKIWMHSCGAIRPCIPDFIDMGVDILNSLQPKATGMDALELKKEFGKDIVFHGGVDMQGSLSGSKQQAIDETKRVIDAYAPGGGFIFAPSNHIMEDVPLENFYAMYETAQEYGKY